MRLHVCSCDLAGLGSGPGMLQKCMLARACGLYPLHKPFGHSLGSLAKGMLGDIVHVESFSWPVSSPSIQVAVRLMSGGIIVRLDDV